MKPSHIILTLLLAVFLSQNAWSSGPKDTMHKVKKKETIFGIARSYGITVEDLIKANPEMQKPDYELKKGDFIFIPQAKDKQKAASQKAVKARKSLSLGLMLPLHDVDGDGRRMTEYYRGMLLAADNLKKQGYQIDFYAWNVNIDADVKSFLTLPDVRKCQVIFGPLYSKQVKPLADFCKKEGKKLVIPFSITGNDVAQNKAVYQVYQTDEALHNATIRQFVAKFASYHTVLVDCHDEASQKGAFTSLLRKALAERQMECSITSLGSTNEQFQQAFSVQKPNIVVLNTGKSRELNAVFQRLDLLKKAHPEYVVSLFGYTDWLLYEKYDKENFFKYDTYVPSYFYYNPYTSLTKSIEAAYERHFQEPMQGYMPRFALTGWDHLMYFARLFNSDLKGLKPVQSQLDFQPLGTLGGMQNRTLIFVHYNRNRSISNIVF